MFLLLYNTLKINTLKNIFSIFIIQRSSFIIIEYFCRIKKYTIFYNSNIL